MRRMLLWCRRNGFSAFWAGWALAGVLVEARALRRIVQEGDDSLGTLSQHLRWLVLRRRIAWFGFGAWLSFCAWFTWHIFGGWIRTRRRHGAAGSPCLRLPGSQAATS